MKEMYLDEERAMAVVLWCEGWLMGVACPGMREGGMEGWREVDRLVGCVWCYACNSSSYGGDSRDHTGVIIPTFPIAVEWIRYSSSNNESLLWWSVT